MNGILDYECIMTVHKSWRCFINDIMNVICIMSDNMNQMHIMNGIMNDPFPEWLPSSRPA